MSPQPTTLQQRALDRWVETSWPEDGIRRSAAEGYEYADDLLIQIAEFLGRSIALARGLDPNGSSFVVHREGSAEWAHTKFEKRKAPHVDAFALQDLTLRQIDDLEANALRAPNLEVEVEGVVRVTQTDPDGDPVHFTAVAVRLAHPIAKQRARLLLSAEARR
jgi:hypothetical protein